MKRAVSLIVCCFFTWSSLCQFALAQRPRSRRPAAKVPTKAPKPRKPAAKKPRRKLGGYPGMQAMWKDLARQLQRRAEALSKYKPARFVASLDLGAALREYEGLKRTYPGLGEPFPIDTIKAKYKKQVDAGTLPAGQKPPTDLRCNICDPSEKPVCACLGDPETGDQEEMKKKECLPQFPAVEKRTEKCIPPLTRYRSLLHDIGNFVSYAADRAFAPGRTPRLDEAVDLFYDYGCRTISRMMPGYARIVQVRVRSGLDTTGSWTEEVSPEDFRKEFGKTAKDGGGGKDYEGPAAREEVIEVCTVTHGQLAATLRADLDRFVRSRIAAWGTKKADPKPLEPVTKGPRRNPRVDGIVDTLVTQAARVLTDAQRVPLATHRVLRNEPCQGFPTGGAGRLEEAPFGYPRCVLTVKTYQPTRLAPPGKPAILPHRPACNTGITRMLHPLSTQRRNPKHQAHFKEYGFQDAPIRCDLTYNRLAHVCRGMSNLREPDGFFEGKRHRWRCGYNRPELERRVLNYLLGLDLGALHKRLEHLKGQGFSFVTNRLAGHYRKGGGARVFEATEKQHRDRVQINQSESPPEARLEIGHQNRGAKDRLRREMLRRHVGRWTDAYEYEQMTGFLQKVSEEGGAMAKAFAQRDPNDDVFQEAMRTVIGNLGRKDPQWLWNLYQAIERLKLREFWGDCKELQDICQRPKLAEEIEACKRCAHTAVARYCMKGQPNAKHCAGDPTPIGPSGKIRGGPTFLDHLANHMSLRGLYNAKDEGCFQTQTRITLATYFFGLEQSEWKDIGMRTLMKLPITAWQRCYLVTDRSVFNRNPKVCEDSVSFVDQALGFPPEKLSRSRWHFVNHTLVGSPPYPLVGSPLFDQVRGYGPFQRATKEWADMVPEARASAAGWEALMWKGKPPASDPCFRQRGHWGAVVGHWQHTVSQQEYWGVQGGGTAGPNGKEAGDAVMEGAAPFVGKILGMLLERAGISDMMKTLAKAAGLTPEQSSDCEDPEYRREQMKIPAKDPKTGKPHPLDNKRGCLTKVFAKNFVSVLESIIVMLGNKLVDWVVQALRTAFMGLKESLRASAGAVPFVGWILSGLIEIIWVVLMDVGLPMLLKGLVVAKLPEWMKIKELAKHPVEKFVDHPILSVVLGIVLSLLDAAVTYGNRGWLEVGFATVLASIKAGLEREIQKGDKAGYFFVRALVHAKKKLLAEKGEGSLDIGAQVQRLAAAMIEGAGAAIARNLEDPLKGDFDLGIADLADQVRKGASELRDILTEGALREGPVAAFTRVLQKFGPVVLGTVVALVKMDPWVKDLLMRIHAALKDPQKGLFAAIRDAVCTVGKGLIQSARIDEDLKTLLLGYLGHDKAGLCSLAAEDVQNTTPCKLAGTVLRLSKPFLRVKVAKAVADVPIEAAKDKLQEGVDKLVDEVAGRLEGAQCSLGNLDLNLHLGKLAVGFSKIRLPSLGGSLGWPDFKFPSLSFDFLFGKWGFFDFDLPSFDIVKFFLDWDFKLWLPKLSLALGTFSFGDLKLDLNLGGLLWGILNAIRLWLPQCNLDLSKRIGEAVRPLVTAVMDKLPAPLKSAVGPKLDGLLRDKVDHLTYREAIRKAVQAILEALVQDDLKRKFYLAAFEVLLAGFCNNGKLMNDAAAKQKLQALFVSMLDLLWAQARFGSPTVKTVSDKLFVEIRALVVALFSPNPPKSAKQWAGQRLAAVSQELLGHLTGPSSPFNPAPEPFREVAKSVVGRIGAWLTDPKAAAQLGKTPGCAGAAQVVNGLVGDGLAKLGGAGPSGVLLGHVIDTLKGQACQLTSPTGFKNAANGFVKTILKKLAEKASTFVQSLVANVADFVVQ